MKVELGLEAIYVIANFLANKALSNGVALKKVEPLIHMISLPAFGVTIWGMTLLYSEKMDQTYLKYLH